MAGQTTWDKNTNVFDKVLTVASFTATTPSGSIVFSSTANPVISGALDMQNLVLSGDLTVSGTAYFNSIIAVTSSYSSGSTVFGDALVDTHQFTGSVFITGSSFNWNNSRVIASNITSSMSVASASQALTASYFNGTVTSASYALTASFLQGTVTSASYALTASFLQGTASNAFWAVTASKISISNLASDAGTYFPMFADNASGPVSLFADASTYTYQPSTNILTVTSSLALRASGSLTGSLRGTASWATNAVFANGATYADQIYIAENTSPGTYSIPVYPDGGFDGNNTLLSANISYEFSTQALTVNNITASNGLFGTSSWATRALTASYVTPYEGAWISYTPVWTAASVNPVINNGTIEGWYKLVGKTCFVRGNIAMGSTTTFGSGEWYVSMPFTASHADAILMTANLLDNTTAWYNAVVNGARAGFNYKAPLQYQAVGGTANDVNATQPFTWASSDRFIWNGSFEIA
jgi:hypothetical protein